MSSLEAARDLIVIAGVGVAGYFAWQWYQNTFNKKDAPGTQYSTYYVPSPDTTDKDHPFHNTLLDPVFDVGWDYIGRARGNTQDWYNMKGWDYWTSWTKGGRL